MLNKFYTSYSTYENDLSNITNKEDNDLSLTGTVDRFRGRLANNCKVRITWKYTKLISARIISIIYYMIWYGIYEI